MEPKNYRLSRFNYQILLRELFVHRTVITAAVIGIVVWFLLTGTHKGQSVWIANRNISPGESISQTDFSAGWIETNNYENLVTELNFEKAINLIAAVPAGSPLLHSQIGATNDANRITISLPLEAGDAGEYPAGATANIWGIRDGAIDLISSDATILGTTNSNLGSARLSLSLPAAAEFDAVTVSAIRVVLKSRP